MTSLCRHCWKSYCCQISRKSNSYGVCLASFQIVDRICRQSSWTNCEFMYTPPTRATKQFRRVGVGGVYWALARHQLTLPDHRYGANASHSQVFLFNPQMSLVVFVLQAELTQVAGYIPVWFIRPLAGRITCCLYVCASVPFVPARHKLAWEAWQEILANANVKRATAVTIWRPFA